MLEGAADPDRAKAALRKQKGRSICHGEFASAICVAPLCHGDQRAAAVDTNSSGAECLDPRHIVAEGTGHLEGI